MRRFSLLSMTPLILCFVASDATIAWAQGSHDRRSSTHTTLVDRLGEKGDTLSFSMSPERWKYGSVPSTGLVVNGRVPIPASLLDVPGKHNAELHWYSPYAAVKESDLDPSLTDAEGAQDTRPVIALSVPRRPITAAPSDTLWISLIYPLDPVGLDFSKSGAIEFWVNDWRDVSLVRGPGLKLHVDVGVVSEDQMRAPNIPPNRILDTEDREPRDQILTQAEDTGLDGKVNADEGSLPTPDLVTADPVDPQGDDYREYDAKPEDELDPRNWRRINGTEGNKQVYPYPDTEDLNLNNDLDTQEGYFEYTIGLSDTSRRYLVSDVYAEFAGRAVPHPPGPDNGWRRYRIPIDDAARVQFGAPSLAMVRHVRIWVDEILSPDGPEDPVSQERPILMLASTSHVPHILEAVEFGAPNPFVTSTTFAYRLGAPTLVRAVVLDLQGREVTVLEDGPRNAGYHAFAWDGRDGDGRLANPGLYFVRARIEGSPDRLWRVIRLR